MSTVARPPSLAPALRGNALEIPGVLSGWTPSLEADGAPRRPDGVRPAPGGFRFVFGALVWTWRVDARPGRLLVASDIANGGDAPVRLGKTEILRARADALAGRGDLRVLVLPMLHGQSNRVVLPVASPAAPRQSQTHIQFGAPGGGFAAQVGFTTFRRLMTVCSWEGDGAVRTLSAYGDFGGWALAPGARTPFEEFTIAVGDSPFGQLEAWADLAAGRLRPVFRETPALGFAGGAWSWRRTRGGSPEDDALENLDAVNARLPGYGFQYLWVSNVNIPGGNLGDWEGWNTRNLPHGRAWLARECERRGFRLGLWIAPFLVCSTLAPETLGALDGAICRKEDGTPQVVFEAWRHGDAGALPPGKHPRVYALDPSRPETRDFIRRALSTLRRDGVRYYMADFLKAGAGPLDNRPARLSGADGLVPNAETFTAFLDLVREAAGPETYLLGCSGPTVHCAGSVDAVRTAGDMGEGRAIHPGCFLYPASFAINRLDFWMGPERALYNTASYYTHRRLYLNDLGNVLAVDKPIPLEHARIAAAIHCFAGSSTMLGDDIREISESRLALVRATFPREPGPALPEDLFSGEAGAPPSVHRYDFPDASVFAVYNTSPRPRRHVLRRAGSFVAWEFFGERLLGAAADAIEVEVPPESVRVFRLVGGAGGPRLLASDTSLTGRDAAARWDAASGALALAVRRPSSERGSLFLYAPPGWHVENTGECHIAKDTATEELVISVSFRTDAGGAWSGAVRFGRDRIPEGGGEDEATRFG